MKYDVIIVGGGVAGLTSAAYLSNEGFNVLLCEKDEKVGGLVNSFDYKGFTFDGGIRSIENSGIVLPMLKQLGLDVDFVRSLVSVGYDKEVIKVESIEDLETYRNLLYKQFPDNKKDIDNILKEIKRIMKYMDILYGIDNPIFLDPKKDRKYFITKIIPWLFKYLFTYKKIDRYNEPFDEFLSKITKNQSLIDMIGQHFFKKTPTFFALSYFSLYLDYRYPKKGTGVIVEKLRDYITDHNGTIATQTEVVEIDYDKLELTTKDGQTHQFKQLIWAADMKALYRVVNIDKLQSKTLKNKILETRKYLSTLKGNDSIVTTYVTVDLDPTYFEDICTEHFFYTPDLLGLSQGVNQTIPSGKEEMIQWLKDYYKYTTYEVSIPALRNHELAPTGKTGLIISTLFDYELVKSIADAGWYDEFKQISEQEMLTVFSKSIYPGIHKRVLDSFVSTPLTIESRTGNLQGAITGWSFTNQTMPSVNRIMNISKSVLTEFSYIYQAGQWTYSPSGFPISLLTGKLAANKVKKNIKNKR